MSARFPRGSVREAVARDGAAWMFFMSWSFDVFEANVRAVVRDEGVFRRCDRFERRYGREGSMTLRANVDLFP